LTEFLLRVQTKCLSQFRQDHLLITAIIALPITYSANRFQSFNRYVGAAAGAFSVGFGLFLVHHIGFVDALLR